MKTFARRFKLITFLLGFILFSNTIFSQEILMFNDTIEFTDQYSYGYYWIFDLPDGHGINWRTPYDYYDGQMYVRYEILNVPTSEPFGIQMGYWQYQPSNPAIDYSELMEFTHNINTINGTDTIIANSSPSSWYKIHGGIDFSRMDNLWRYGFIIFSMPPYTKKPLAHPNYDGDPTVWSDYRDNWLPCEIYITAVNVAEGETFSGWDNYVGVKPPMTDYDIDYLNGTTDAAVPATDEYSTNLNMSGAQSGTGVPIPLTPGQTYYFRTKAEGINPRSDIQQLPVPAAPIAPGFEYSKITEKTTTQVAVTQEYSMNSDMSAAVDGTGTTVNVIPGETMYFRTRATASAFASDIQALAIDPRPAGPNYTISYANSATVENVPTNVIYSSSSDMSSASSGNNSTASLTPGTDVYFRFEATASEFASEIFHLSVPDKPLLTSEAGNNVNTLPFTVNIVFPHEVTGFNVTDLNIDNGTGVYLRDNFKIDIVAADPGIININIDANIVNEGNFASDNLRITYSNEISGINEKISNPFILYPNPSDGNFTIDMNNNENTEIEITDITGKTVYKNIYNANVILIAANNLSNGYYFIKIITGNSIDIQKILIQK